MIPQVYPLLSVSSAQQRIHMKHQAILSSKDKSKKKIEVSSAATLPGSFRIKILDKYNYCITFKHSNV